MKRAESTLPVGSNKRKLVQHGSMSSLSVSISVSVSISISVSTIPAALLFYTVYSQPLITGVIQLLLSPDYLSFLFSPSCY